MSLPTELLEKAIKATEAHESTILHIHALDLAREVLQMRAELAALTDPSPEAQLRRYREAEVLVKNPPKIAYEWTTFYILGRRMWCRFAVGTVEVVARVSPGPDEDAEKAKEDARLTAAGWQLEVSK